MTGKRLVYTLNLDAEGTLEQVVAAIAAAKRAGVSIDEATVKRWEE